MEETNQVREVSNPFAAAPNGKKMLTLVGIYVCLIGTIFQSATASTVLPTAAVEIGGADIYALANTLPTVISVIAMPLWGFFGAKNPAIKRPLYVFSMVAGVICLFGRAFSSSMMMLIVFSLFWGFPSAGMYVLGYSMIRDSYDSKKAGVYLGLCATMQSIGMLVGPVLGGLILDFASWRVAWIVMGVIVAAGTVLVFFGVKATKEEAASMATASGKFDLSGSIAVVVFLGCLICALSLGSTYLPFGSVASFAVFGISIVGLIVLIVVIKKKGDNAIVPASAMKDRNTLMFCGSIFFTNFSNMAVFFFLPMYVMTVMGCSATQASLTTTLLSIAGLFMGPIFGRMIGKSGTARGVLSFGSILRIVVAVALLFVLAPDANVFVVYVIMFCAGFYNVTGGVCFSAGPQVQLDPKIRVQGNSVIQLCQNFGGGVGTAVYTVILASMGVVEGMPVALTIAAVTAALALVFALFLKKLDK